MGWNGADLEKVNSQLEEIASVFYNPKNIMSFTVTDEYDGELISVAELYSMWDNLVSEYPMLLSKTIIGRDQSDTYDIFEIIFSPQGATKKIILQANIHAGGQSGTMGDSKDPSLILYNFIKDILENPNATLTHSDIRFNLKISFIPILNPWGYDNDSRYNSRGVDLNRNYDYSWWSDGSPVYGTNAFSESESLISKNWMARNSDAVGFIDFHAFGDTNTDFSFPGFYSELNIAGKAILTSAEYSAKKYKANEGVSQSSTGGTARMYCEKVIGIPSIAIEYPTYSATAINQVLHDKEMQGRLLTFFGSSLYRMFINSAEVSSFSSRISSAINFGTQSFSNVTSTDLTALSLNKDELGCWNNSFKGFVIPKGVTRINVFAQIGFLYTGTVDKDSIVQVRVTKNNSTEYIGCPRMREFLTFKATAPFNELFCTIASVIDVEENDLLKINVYVAGVSTGEVSTRANTGSTYFAIADIS